MARLGDFIEQIRGVSYKPDDVCPELRENCIALLRANNIREGQLNFDDVVFVDKKRVHDNQLLKAGDILICTSSGSKELVGKAAYVQKDLPMTFGAFCKVVRPQKIRSDYLGHFFNSPNYRQKISDSSAGANINNIRNEHIDDLEILLPTADRQEHIAIVLNKLTNLISLRKQQLAKLDELVKARFVEMFGDPITNSKCLATRELIQIITLQRGYDLPVHSRDSSGNIPVYESNGVLDYHSQNKSTCGVITGRSGTIGKVYYCKEKFWPLNTTLFSIETYGNNIIFLAHLLEYYKLDRFHDGTGVPTLNRNVIHRQPIIDVPVSQQEIFAAFVEEVSRQKLTIQQSLDKMEVLKRSLMQEYFGNR